MYAREKLTKLIVPMSFANQLSADKGKIFGCDNPDSLF